MHPLGCPTSGQPPPHDPSRTIPYDPARLPTHFGDSVSSRSGTPRFCHAGGVRALDRGLSDTIEVSRADRPYGVTGNTATSPSPIRRSLGNLGRRRS